MKTNLPGTSIAAALLCLTPLASVAQNIPSHPSVNRSLDRLTLLPGPYLLSPARTTPTMMPSPIKLGAVPFYNSVPFFSFVPAASNAVAPLPASKSETTKGAPSFSLPATRPPPEALRFDAKLESPLTPPKIEFRSQPKTP